MKQQTVVDEYVGDIYKLFERTGESVEFEIDVNMNKSDITYEKYVEIMKYMTYIKNSQKKDLVSTIVLDINYGEMVNDVRHDYRVDIAGKDVINKYSNLLKNKRNHVVFNFMTNLFRDKKHDNKIKMYHKSKQYDSMFDIPELNSRVRVSREDDVSPQDVKKLTQLDDTHSDRIIFRYKQRLSLVLDATPDYSIKMELTNVKSSTDLDTIDRKRSQYELEIEFFNKTGNVKNIKSIFDTVMSTYDTLLKVIQRSNYIITKSHRDAVLNEYKKLLGVVDKTIYNIDGRQPVSLEIQHAVETLSNRYAAVDKADGDRCFVIVCFGHVYLISQNLNVKDTGIALKNSEYDGTLFDCEYVYNPKYKRDLILVFDCLFAKKEDVRTNPMLMERIGIANKIINKCFIFGKQIGVEYGEYVGKNTVDAMVTYYSKQLDKYVETLLHDMECEKRYPIIRTKYFIPVSGLSDNEIFKYSMIIWNKYTKSDVKYPYSLDGIVYQPLNQQYTTNVKETRFQDYKWKPSEKNTIDFYVRFERDPVTNKILDIFDNSNDTYESNKPYRICYLYNGKRSRTGETPVFFNEEKKSYIAYLFSKNGNVFDANGDIIQDETVVEFRYDNNIDVNDKFKWIPLRTRYDKTEMVNKYKIKYGNSIEVAVRIWRSIIVPVRISDIFTLANDEMYVKHLSEMRNKITHELIISAAKENVYYQTKTNLAEPMRNFHNWIKSVAIFTYCGVEYNNRKSKTVLDVGCGRGGDLMKFYHAKISSGVCIDIDYETLHSAVDGAISRYEGHRKKYPAFPKMSILCADFTVPLDADSQLKVIQDKTQENKYMLEKIFPRTGMQQFDVINSQFSFHYFLQDDKTWSNACANINKCLKRGGILIITTFDAQRVIDVIGEKNNYTTYYTTNGEKKIFTDIVKKFPKDKTTGTGLAIDVYNSLISTEGTYITEYLVDRTFVVDELKNKCGLELVDTCMFDTLFEINRDNITRVATYDENEKTRSFLQTVATYYEDNAFNAECFKITRLNRYYIFRKI